MKYFFQLSELYYNTKVILFQFTTVIYLCRIFSSQYLFPFLFKKTSIKITVDISTVL